MATQPEQVVLTRRERRLEDDLPSIVTSESSSLEIQDDAITIVAGRQDEDESTIAADDDFQIVAQGYLPERNIITTKDGREMQVPPTEEIEMTAITESRKLSETNLVLEDSSKTKSSTTEVRDQIAKAQDSQAILDQRIADLENRLYGTPIPGVTMAPRSVHAWFDFRKPDLMKLTEAKANKSDSLEQLQAKFDKDEALLAGLKAQRDVLTNFINQSSEHRVNEIQAEGTVSEAEMENFKAQAKYYAAKIAPKLIAAGGVTVTGLLVTEYAKGEIDIDPLKFIAMLATILVISFVPLVITEMTNASKNLKEGVDSTKSTLNEKQVALGQVRGLANEDYEQAVKGIGAIKDSFDKDYLSPTKK